MTIQMLNDRPGRGQNIFQQKKKKAKFLILTYLFIFQALE